MIGDHLLAYIGVYMYNDIVLRMHVVLVLYIIYGLYMRSSVSAGC